VPKIPRKKRSRAEIAFDRKEIARLIKRGYNKHSIAEQLGLEYSQIASDYRQILRSVTKSVKSNISGHVARTLVELEEVKREAWEAWEKSKKNSKKKVVETSEITTEEGTGERVKIIRTTEGRIPEAKFLSIIEKCIDSEKKLLGLDASKKLDINVETDIPWQKLAGRIVDENQLKREVDELISDGLLLPPPEKEIDSWDMGIPNISPGEEREFVERKEREKARDNSVIILSPDNFEVKDPDTTIEVKPLMEDQSPKEQVVKKLKPEKKKRVASNASRNEKTTEPASKGKSSESKRKSK